MCFVQVPILQSANESRVQNFSADKGEKKGKVESIEVGVLKATDKNKMAELMLGGVSAVMAGIFSNPLEVLKIRMQLQGELQAKCNYSIYYRNVIHAASVIGRSEGILAIQKGLVPALYFQFLMNGTRLGFYQFCDEKGFTKSSDGKVSTLGSIAVASTAGALGCVVSSPLYLVKTHLQSRSAESIAVGYQHKHSRMIPALKEIYAHHGLKGLWRGTTSSLPRIVVASAVQLPSFAIASEYIKSQGIFKEGSWTIPLTASLASGLLVSFAMSPFDLISTRFYNQGVNASTGKGILYSSVVDCALKIYKIEGLFGFYKGWSANYLRIGPHTALCLVFWDQLKYYYKQSKSF